MVADLAGVGENLHDHAAMSENIFTDNLPGVSLSANDLSLSNIVDYLKHGTGKAASVCILYIFFSPNLLQLLIKHSYLLGYVDTMYIHVTLLKILKQTNIFILCGVV